MSVPTHNLYDFVHQATKKQFLLRYFYPYSSKDLQNLTCHITPQEFNTGPNQIDDKNRFDKVLEPRYNLDFQSFLKMQPILICHDQEPLHFDLFADESKHMTDFFKSKAYFAHLDSSIKDLNLKWCDPWSVQKTWTLLHSELNSTELDRYEATGQFKGAYWWSHAMLALDWYRYAEHDLSLKYNNSYQKLFLIYCRDQTGSRTYRRDFMQQIVDLNIIQHCQTHSVRNYTTSSDSSAEYESTDFNYTAISVVLETIFDSRIHLTEKTLRPLACGHPFILAAGPGSLELLRKYGFETFNPYINESYDMILDSSDRLRAITAELRRISLLPSSKQQELVSVCNQIAQKNQQRFFSKEFRNYVTEELQTNVQIAFDSHQGEFDLDTWWQRRKWYKKIKGLLSSTTVGPHIALLHRQRRHNVT
jgi:hypothetical protein